MSMLTWRPLSAEVEAALTRVENAASFDAIAEDYVLVEQEAKERAVPAFFAMLPAMIVFAAIILSAGALGWIPADGWSYLLWLLIVPFTAVVTNALRGPQAVKAEQRIGKALDKWRDQAEAGAST